MKGKSLSGSMTVFSSLVLLMILSLLFTLLEAARVEDLNATFQLDSRLLAESAFAQYDVELYENYDLLLLDGSYGGESVNLAMAEYGLQQLAEENLTVSPSVTSGNAVSFLQGELTSCEMSSYELATDQNGEAFYRVVTDYMRETITQQAARELYAQITDAQAASEEAGDLNKRMDDADAGIEQVKKELAEAEKKKEQKKKKQSAQVKMETAKNTTAKNTTAKNTTAKNTTAKNTTAKNTTAKTTTSKDTTSKDTTSKDTTSKDTTSKDTTSKDTASEEPTPMDQVRDMKNTAVLSLVLEDANAVSDRAIEVESLIEKRECNQGNWTQQTASDQWYDRILYNQYVVSHFANYLEPNEQGALGYEQEYILVGKSSDKANLTGVAERLLAIREAVNYVELHRNPTKCAEALALATTLAGATGNALVIKIVKEGILAAWAFEQSTGDVKQLLKGERLSLGNGKIGLGYQDYLRILLFLEGKEKQNYHCMDMIEQNMRLLEGRSAFRMDGMIDQAAFEFRYQASPLFLSFVSLAHFSGGAYYFTYQESYSYLTG